MQPQVDITHEKICNNQIMELMDKDLERGKRLSKAIESSVMSRAEIAEHLDVTPQAVWKWCKTGKISREKIIRLAGLLNVDVSYLSTGTGSSTLPKEMQTPHKTINSHRLAIAISFLIREHGDEILELPVEQLSEVLAKEYNSLP